MERKLTEAFDAVHMDDSCAERIENAMAKKHTDTRNHTFSSLRLALAAACLCLLLPVTAVGIGTLFRPVALGKQTVTDEMSSYHVVADVVQWSQENFSEELQTDLERGSLQQVFHDKESLEGYLGISLSDSPTLEEAGLVENLSESFAYGFNLRPQLALDPAARYILTACDWEGNAVTTDPDVLKISSHRVLENSEVYLDAWLIMDSVTQEQLEEGILGENFLPVTGWTTEMVYDENGNFVLNEDGYPAVETKEFTSSEYAFTSEAYTMSNRNTATIITSRFVEPDGRYGLYEYMGYFIHDGILYTVRPYAIYDPTLDYPMNDYDMLDVLKVVLDTFA